MDVTLCVLSVGIVCWPAHLHVHNWIEHVLKQNVAFHGTEELICHLLLVYSARVRRLFNKT